MCTVMGAITAMSAITGGISSFASSAQRLQEEKKANEYSMAVARNNANVEAINAQSVRDEGKKEIENARNEKSALMGKIKATQSSSGVTLNGSPTDSLVSVEKQHQYNVNNIKEATERNAWGHNVNANNAFNQARFTAGKSVGDMNSGIDGLISGVSSGVKGVFDDINFGKSSSGARI